MFFESLNSVINFISDPLEQFDIKALTVWWSISCSSCPFINVFFFKFNYLNIVFILQLNIFIFYFFFSTLKKKTLTYIIKINIIEAISDLVSKNINIKKHIYIPYLLFIFIIVYINNMSGMIPYSYTTTSSLILTFFISLTTYVGINILGSYLYKFKFFSAILPGGTPIFIAPFLTLIELVSYIAKVFSLAIRLFTNMLSGHTLLKILIGFVWSIFALKGIGYVLAFIPAVIVFIVTFLELLIAFFQAYVFVVLSSIYINDTINLH